jgi:low affinity Fe/Cu permease
MKKNTPGPALHADSRSRAHRCPTCGGPLAAEHAAENRAHDAARSGHSRAATFSTFARAIARWSGRPVTFGAAVLLVVLWLVTGPLFHYSDTWQLIINTSTTIITFWMVFVIQHTQNRDTEAMQIKLDEIIRATRGAHNALMGLEDADDEELEAYRRRFAVAAAAARAALDEGASDSADDDGEASAPAQHARRSQDES